MVQSGGAQFWDSLTGAIVTDVGSVKGEISRQGHTLLDGRAHFVGSHPMAGSEKTGAASRSARWAR